MEALVNYNSPLAIFTHNNFIDFTDLLSGSVAEKEGFVYARIGISNVKIKSSHMSFAKSSYDKGEIVNVFEFLMQEECLIACKELPYKNLENGEAFQP